MTIIRQSKQKHLKFSKKTEEEINLEDYSAQTVSCNRCEVVLDTCYHGMQNDGVREILQKKETKAGSCYCFKKAKNSRLASARVIFENFSAEGACSGVL